MTETSTPLEVRRAADVEIAPRTTTVVYVHRLNDEIASALVSLPLEEIQGDGNPQITDIGLRALGAIASLEFLDLEWAAEITDEGLEHLHRIPSLKWVDLGGCAQVSAAGIARLERALPECVVETLTRRPHSRRDPRTRDLRKINERCPACLTRLPRTARGTRKARRCPACGSTYRPRRTCQACSTTRVWSGPLGDFCKGCGTDLRDPGAA